MYFFTFTLKKKRIKLFFLLLVFLSVSGFFLNCWSGILPEEAMAPVYHGSTREKKIALTFNVVWGEEYIRQLLDCLNEENVKATFFIGGQWAEDFPELTREIAGNGHEIGNHGYSHPHPDRLSLSANKGEIKKTEDVLFRVAAVKTVLFAPPYGERGNAVLRAAEEAGYTTVLWSIDTIDWQRPNPSVIVRRVAEGAHNGAIVLMHPTAPTVHALPLIIRNLKEQGYELVKVSALIEGLKKEEAVGEKTGA
ncbi:MAG: polysaccharide deacetylase family protein [Pelotomaculum sp.]|nr:polysaccharide deacetylase family protein [Pelotomaculum sp.]